MMILYVMAAILVALLIDVFLWRVIPFLRTLVRAKRQRMPDDWFNFIQ